MNYYFKEDWFDLRNEYSVETSHKILDILGVDLENFHPEYTGFINRSSEQEEDEDLSFEVEFVEKLSRTHRTLQQTFSGMVFHWLGVMQEAVENPFLVQVSQKITQNVEEDFHRTPMI